ncbi:MAG: thioredoxin domain-containing protein [Phycisphaerales bacterium]
MASDAAHPSRHAPNRLLLSRSPYLVQHAHNPVDWHEWGEEAFAAARARNVPIFLSIGYSTCYWCHVMERESFEDAGVAAVMNERFVCIKVDREERPDVDDLYMAAIQMLTGRGGWPMSVFLEPHTLKPYWGGTYFPPRPAHGLPSFRQALEGMSDAYRDKRPDVMKQASAIAGAIAEKMGGCPPQAVHIGRPQGAMAVQTLLTIFDRVHGGFGSAPKFPQPVYLELLLDARERAPEPAARAAIDAALRLTLDRMAMGGMFDQVGGGFHRYSVDGFWLVPHFEKMLYDNAQLLSVYARAAVAFNDPFYRRIAERIVAYVRREMTAMDGAFFTAQDAEVDGREGLNYLWTPDEVRAALADLTSPERERGVRSDFDTAFALDLYGLNSGPNFQDPHHPAEPARNVLHLGERPEATAARLGLTVDALNARVDAINAGLLAARHARKQPRLDDKILTSWNGLMIAALADAGRLLNQPAWIDAADRAATAVLRHALTPAGTLRRTRRAAAPAAVEGILDDYAMLASGLLALARTGGADRLAQAEGLVAEAESTFADPRGGFFDTRADQPDLFVRARSTYDGAIPSAISVMIANLVGLAERTGNAQHARRAGAALASISSAIAESPISAANSTRALLRVLDLDESALVAALRDAGAPDIGAGGSATPLAVAGATSSDVVSLMASAEEIDLAPGEPVECTLRCVIADGFHLVAADPGEEGIKIGLIPFRVEIDGGTGVAVFADYPPGEPLDASTGTVGGGPLVYRGSIDLTIALERDEATQWSGEPRVVLSFQACNETECHAPERLRLGIVLRAVD